MPEAYGWSEGTVSIFTAGTAVSATIAYCENTNANISWGWDNKATLSGAYRDVLTGQRMDVTIQAIYTNTKTFQRMALSATAVHMKFNHSSVNGTAGFWGFSGRIDAMPIVGGAGENYKFSLRAHFNNFSAF